MAPIKGPEVQEFQVQWDQGLRCHQISVSLTTREAFCHMASTMTTNNPRHTYQPPEWEHPP